MRLNNLVKGVHYFSEAELFQKAAALKGLELEEPDSCYSKAIKDYELTEDLLAVLARESIEKKTDGATAILLIDKNFPEPNEWYLTRNTVADKFKISLFIDLEISEKGEIIFKLKTRNGSCSSPLYQGSHLRMFNILSKDDRELLKVVKELAAGERITVDWSDFGLEGLMNINSLFRQFINGNDDVWDISVAKHKKGKGLFKPSPFPKESGREHDFFYIKSVQPFILRAWCRQLKKYLDSLVVPRRKRKEA